MKYVVIADFSGLWHMARHIALGAPQEFDLHEATTYHLKGKLRTIERKLKELGADPIDYFIMAEDRQPVDKLATFPEYRGKRENNQPDRDAVKGMLKAAQLGLKFCHSDKKEADDVIATLVKKALAKPDLTPIVVAMDCDLWQLCNERTVVFNPKTMRFIELQDIIDKFGVKPNQIGLHKAFWGDGSDCIPNVMPRTQKHIMPLMRQTDGSLEQMSSMMLEVASDLPGKVCDLWEGARLDIVRNYDLVKLNPDCELVWG